MKYLLLLLSAVLLFWSGTVTLAAETGVRPADLRCEYLVNPLGLDIKQPRLSWILESAQRNQAQTAYQVLVATTEDLLKQDKGDLWDSGKVASDDSIAIVYAGQPLAGHQRCCWKVKVWDRNGKPSPWSSPALWSMGVLDAREWDAAAWIGYDKPREKAAPEADFDGAKWIWHAADKGPNKPKGHRLFLTTLALPEGAKVEKAELLVVADDAFKFTINGRDVANGTSWKEPKQVEVQGHLKPGKNTLRVEVENAAPSPAGLLVKLTVKIAGGQTLTLVSDASWKSLGQPGANWHNRTIDLDPLPAAEVIAAYGDQPWGKLTYAPLRLYPPVMLRTSFTLTKPVCRATLYPTALGLVDVYVNGKRVSEDRFNPGWTDYTKRVYYRAYDVTGLVHSARTPWEPSSPMAGTAATSALAANAITTARSRASVDCCTSTTPMAPVQRSPPVRTGRRRPDPLSKAISSWARLSTPVKSCPGGTAQISTIADGTKLLPGRR